MATLYAQGNQTWNGSSWSGVWNTAANGSGSNQTPASGDTLEANAKTITISGSLNLGSGYLNTLAGGSFSVGDLNGITITANVGLSSPTATATILSYAGTGTNALSLVGNIVGGNGSSVVGVTLTTTGVLNVTGNVTGGNASSAYGLSNTSSGTVNIGTTATPTTITGGSASNAHGVFNSSGGTINVVGNESGSVTVAAVGILNNGTGTINSTGNTTGGGAASSNGINNTNTGSVNIGGNATGGTNGTAYGVSNSGTGIVTIAGTAIASALAPGANNVSTGKIVCFTAQGNAYGPGNTAGLSIGIAGLTNNSSGLAEVCNIKYGTYGATPTYGPVLLRPIRSFIVSGASATVGSIYSHNGAYFLVTATISGANALLCISTGPPLSSGTLTKVVGSGDATIAFSASSAVITAGTAAMIPVTPGSPDTFTPNSYETFIDANATATYPSPSDVRYGTSYNSGNLTGTCYVPAAASTASGIPVDNTVGTAVLTAAAVRDATTTYYAG